MGSGLCVCYERNEEREPLNRRLVLDFNKYQDVNHEGAPVGKKWYHGRISNDEADFRLMAGARGHDGSYIVYDNPRVKGQYILLIYYKREKLRMRIQRVRGGMYILGKDGPGVDRYRSVKELIKAHRGLTGKPIRLNNGDAMTLSRSYVYEVEETDRFKIPHAL